MSKKGRILVAMSGGVDSTVSAMLLHQEGYEVVGITIKTWDYETSGGTKKETGCCSIDSINDARNAAVRGGFHHIMLDLRAEFKDSIIDNFVSEYLQGRTPNPCVLCNTHIKWDALLRRADKLDCEYIATGHYARLKEQNGRYFISRGADSTKDQSYVLWGISQQNLARTKFPLGSFRKKEIKQMAVDFGLRDISEKAESYEICFIPDNDYRGFLQRKAKNELEELEGGPLTDTDGHLLGTHRGYPFYTIGQRRGLGVAADAPLYVVDIHPETNTVVLGYEDHLLSSAMKVGNINTMKYAHIEKGTETLVQIRHRDKGRMATLSSMDEEGVQVDFIGHASAVTPGQSSVFYDGDDIIAGGIITEVIKKTTKTEQKALVKE